MRYVAVAALVAVILAATGLHPVAADIQQATRLYEQARGAYDRGECERALPLINQAIGGQPEPKRWFQGNFPKYYYPYYLRGLIDDCLGQHEKAVSDFQEELKHDAIKADTKSLNQLNAALEKARGAHAKSVPQEFTLAGNVPTEIFGSSGLVANGRALTVKALDPAARKVVFLGEDGLLRSGLNVISNGVDKAVLWVEERRLTSYEEPYSSSYAILVAIDDYGRKRDPLRRGKTEFRPLGGMVENTEALKKVLLKVGFPENHIVTLYDEKAESGAVNDALYKFWQGGAYDSAGRVLFYFGGHGTISGNSGILVTYDYDPKKPTRTGILMKDLTGRHADNMMAHHVLFAVDACHSGLALYETLGNEPVDENLMSRFRQLAVIKAETEHRARNVLVAGTGAENALWENGGVFTKALIDGLKGAADWNKDGIIQFDELALHIKDQVVAVAERTRVEQKPGKWSLPPGDGKILFETPEP